MYKRKEKNMKNSKENNHLIKRHRNHNDPDDDPFYDIDIEPLLEGDAYGESDG
jgi:hypothetical protein